MAGKPPARRCSCISVARCVQTQAQFNAIYRKAPRNIGPIRFVKFVSFRVFPTDTMLEMSDETIRSGAVRPLLREHALAIWQAGVEAAKPDALVRRALAELAEPLRDAQRIL